MCQIDDLLELLLRHQDEGTSRKFQRIDVFAHGL